MNNRREILLVLLLLIITSFLRFYGLMHDAPYFFNPDERNMAIAISQLRLPNKLSEVSSCLLFQFYPQLTTHNQQLDNCNLNPHFFAYGQFPLYLAFISDQVIKPIANLFTQQPTTHNLQLTTTNYLSTSHSSAIFYLRFWSALSSTITVLLVYLVTNILTNNFFFRFSNFDFRISNLAAIMAAFSPGLIQSAHFGTTESLLTFFFLASIYFSIRLLQSKPHLSYLTNLKYALILSIIIGLAIGTKFTGIIFLAPPLLTLMIQIIKVITKQRKKVTTRKLGYCLPAVALPCRQAGLAQVGVIGLFLIVGSIIFSIASSPFNLIDLPGFKGSVFGYEADVALGKYEAFYTRQFVATTPILFQMEKIFPYALGWPIFILGALGFLSMNIKILNSVTLSIFRSIKYQVLRIKRRKQELNILNTYYIILSTSFLVYFLPNAFLFAKWTRFMTPVFPFFAVFAGYFIFQIHQWLMIAIPKIQNYNSKLKILIFAFCVLTILPGIAFMSIYAHEDSRVTASRWIWQNIPDKSYLLFETANVIDIPLGIPGEKLPNNTYTLVSFDYYHLDENKELFSQLLAHLEKADYIFIPSRRIFANYLRLPKRYPLITKYYQLLYSGALGFEKAAQFNSFPQLSFSSPGRWPNGLLPGVRWQFSDENAEESFTVFDHPVIRIYKKTKSLDKNAYLSLFSI